MKIKTFFSFIFLIIVFSLLVVYYLSPFTELEFSIEPANYNFSTNINSSLADMQFYPNMRFPTTFITYNIQEQCSLKKKQEMNDAFDIVENLTDLNFIPVLNNADINVTCNETTRYQEGMFIAGEGGPTRIVRAGDLNVIESGSILLIRDSNCERPNIAIHELFHVLGFKHSDNPNNIMYNYTKCKQTIGEDNVQLLKQLYSIESLPDLLFNKENTSIFMHGRYLDLNVTINNFGLIESNPFIVKIIANDKEVKEILLDKIKTGNGKIINLKNVWISVRNPKNINLSIQSDFEELSKENNIISFQVSKKE